MKYLNLNHHFQLSIEDLFIIVYVYVDDDLKLLLGRSNSLRCSNNHNPRFTDAEVITIQIVGELLSMDSQKAWLNLVRKNWGYLFPFLPHRTRFGRRLRRLFAILGLIQRRLSFLTDANFDRCFLVDSIPISVCHVQRLIGSTKPFEYCATVGYNPSKKSYFYGFKGHLATDLRGIPRFMFLTPAHVPDAQALEWMVEEIQKSNFSGFPPRVIGDKGYVGKARIDFMAKEFGITVLPMARNYAKAPKEPALNEIIIKTRKILETTIALLADQFHIEKTRCRSVQGLITSLISKLVAFTFCCLLNVLNASPCLEIKKYAF